MNLILPIAAGGALGAVARFLVSGGVQRLAGGGFPWGTLAVNAIGGFVMGLIVEASARSLSLSLEWRAFLTTGVLGGFTTFSAFSLETALLLEKGQMMTAALYVVASFILSVGALFGGLYLIRSLA